MTEKELEKLKENETYVGKFLNGSDQQSPLTPLQRLILWKLQVLDNPYLTSNLTELDGLILRELKKK